MDPYDAYLRNPNEDTWLDAFKGTDMLDKEQRQRNLLEFAAAAVAFEESTKFPALLAVVQWALESGWGEKQTGDNNFWGITAGRNWYGAVKWCPTREALTNQQIEKLDPEERETITSVKARGDGRFDVCLKRKFRSYRSINEALQDYRRILVNGPRYEYCFDAYSSHGDVRKLMQCIADAGYATNPAYGQQLITISNQSNVLEAIAHARLVEA